MVDFRITGFEQALQVQGLDGIGALALLLAVQPPFLELLAFRHLAEMLVEQRLVLFVAVPVFGLLFLDV